MALYHSPRVVTDGLVMCLDVGNTKSYPGSGTTWTDLSGSNITHNLLGGAAITTINGVRAIDVSTEGKYTQDAGTTYTFTSNYTMIAWARALADSQVSTWRTLWRTTPDDHPILIEDGTNTIGYYDNNGGAFVSYGLNLATIGKENVWAMYTVVGSGSTTTLYIDDRKFSGSVNYNATGNSHDVFGAAGGSQAFGYIAVGLLYSRALNNTEIDQTFRAFRGRFGL